MTTNDTLSPPAPLDPSVPHHPDEHRRWQREWADYHAALIEREQTDRKRREMREEAEANRVLSDDEYYKLALQRHSDMQAKLAELEAARQAKREAEAAYDASMPEIAEIFEASEFLFLTKLGHWFKAGYELTEDSIIYFVRGCYSVQLKKPATGGTRSKLHATP